MQVGVARILWGELEVRYRLCVAAILEESAERPAVTLFATIPEMKEK